MEFLRPACWREAIEAKAENPDATPIAGGTDVMVELNFDHRRPGVLLDLTCVPELADWAPDGPELRVGAGVPYARLIDELGARLPGLAMASRTVGSPQIRNRGTLGGNLGSASPAGDGHPPLLASGGRVEVESVRGTRVIPVEEFFTGPKRTRPVGPTFARSSPPEVIGVMPSLRLNASRCNAPVRPRKSAGGSQSPPRWAMRPISCAAPRSTRTASSG